MINIGKKKRTQKIFEDRGLEIIDDYVNQSLSYPELKIKYDLTAGTIKNFLIANNIKPRDISETLSLDKFKNKTKKTCLEKYGVSNPSQYENTKKKKRDTFIKNYGIDNIFKTKEFKEKMIQEGRITECIPPYREYKLAVDRETNKHINTLRDKWDGKCYYTGIELTSNPKDYNNPLYYTIDHKNAVLYGYLNGISPEIIGAEDNLCICSRSANSKKQHLTEKEFIKKINEN